MDLSKLKIFVDFDGTITKHDVGEAIFREFGSTEKTDEIVVNLLNDKITARECWEQLLDTIPAIQKEILNKFIDQMEIDETFKNFHKFCIENNIEMFVLSDGFDYYINRIFKNANLNHVKIFANTLAVNENNQLVASFPYFDIDCQTSANCKRNHILNNSGDDDFTILIGDGNSDKYSAEFCDFIFAKNDLLKYCEKKRITYFPFNNFDDIVTRLESFRAKKRLKKRHQAELKRREAYLRE